MATFTKFTVKTLTGTCFRIEDIDTSTASVFDLKQKLREFSSLPVDQLRLVFAGKVLEDSTKLSEHNLEEGCVVHLVLRLS